MRDTEIACVCRDQEVEALANLYKAVRRKIGIREKYFPIQFRRIGPLRKLILHPLENEEQTLRQLLDSH